MASEYDELFREKLAKAYKWANDELIKHNFVRGSAIELLSAAESMKDSEGFMQSLFWDEAAGSVLYRRDWFEEMTVQYNSLTDAQEVRRSAPGLFRKMLENGIWLSEQPEYSYYKAGEQKTEEAGTLSAEEFRTLPIDEKVDRAYRWARQYQREHLLIAQMLSLNFDSDTVDDGNGFKISVFCDEKNKKTLLRRDWYNDSEIRTRYDRLANAEEIKRVAPKSFALMRDNGLMLCEMALKGEKLSAKTDIVACDMFSAFEKYRSEDPEETLTRMRLFILSCAESFRCGEITEEEFFVKTFVRKDLMDKVIELRGHISLNYYYNVTESDMIGFTTAFKRWKESGELEYRQWMVKMINTKGNVLEDAKWVFRVIDTLLIPISSFEVISDKLYTVPIQYLFDGNTVSLFVDDYIIMDSYKDFDRLFEIGKRYQIVYNSGVKADVLIKDFKNDEYAAVGIIYGFMTHEQKLRIISYRNRIHVLFNTRTFSEYQIKLATFFNPVPHPDWNRFNAADLAHSYKAEAEYKTLRLPYMLGMITKEMIEEESRKYRNPVKHGNIISFSDLRKKD